jgi:hypothetical protein
MTALGNAGAASESTAVSRFPAAGSASAPGQRRVEACQCGGLIGVERCNDSKEVWLAVYRHNQSLDHMIWRQRVGIR